MYVTFDQSWLLYLFISETEDAKEIQGNGTLSNDREAYKHLLQTLLSNRLGRSRRFNSCGRHELYINFTEIGLDYYIIQPPGYDAFYCDGSCPLPVETTSHAVLQAMVNTFAPDKSPQPCCVPKSFDPLSVIRSNGENEVVKEDWVDMIVVDCVCR